MPSLGLSSRVNFSQRIFNIRNIQFFFYIYLADIYILSWKQPPEKIRFLNCRMRKMVIVYEMCFLSVWNVLPITLYFHFTPFSKFINLTLTFKQYIQKSSIELWKVRNKAPSVTNIMYKLKECIYDKQN